MQRLVSFRRFVVVAGLLVHHMLESQVDESAGAGGKACKVVEDHEIVCDMEE